MQARDSARSRSRSRGRGRAVFAAERGNGLVYAVALHEKRTVHVDGADGAVDAEEVEFYDGFAGRAFR